MSFNCARWGAVYIRIAVHCVVSYRNCIALRCIALCCIPPHHISISTPSHHIALHHIALHLGARRHAGRATPLSDVLELLRRSAGVTSVWCQCGAIWGRWGPGLLPPASAAHLALPPHHHHHHHHHRPRVAVSSSPCHAAFGCDVAAPSRASHRRIAIVPPTRHHRHLTCVLAPCGDALSRRAGGAAAMPALRRCAVRRRCPCFDARCGGDARVSSMRPAPWLTHVTRAARASPRPGRSEVT